MKMTNWCQSCLLIHKSINNAIHQGCHSDRVIASCPDPRMTPKPKLESVSLLYGFSRSLSLSGSLSLSLLDWLILINGPVRVGFYLLG